MFGGQSDLSAGEGFSLDRATSCTGGDVPACCCLLPAAVNQQCIGAWAHWFTDCIYWFVLQDCVNKTIARIKQKLERDDKRVLNHVIYTMRSSDRAVQQAVSQQGASAAE
jgi:hypothetical protein